MSYYITNSGQQYWNLDQEWQTWVDSDIEFFETLDEANNVILLNFTDEEIGTYDIRAENFA